MRKISKFSVLALLLLSGCAVIGPGEVAIKQRFGKISDKVYTEGLIGMGIGVRVIRASIRVSNLELSINLPSKEGLSIVSQISILYKIDKDQFVELVREVGLNYESIIANVFRSAAADVCAQFYAKDMHSGMRAEIEKAIQQKMNATFEPMGINIDAVLMKSIQLPDNLARSIEEKLQAEQNAMRMEFVLQQARSEGERKIIEANADADRQIIAAKADSVRQIMNAQAAAESQLIEAKARRESQRIISESLTEQLIRVRSIQAFEQLSKSNNTKTIITNGKTPFLIDEK